MDLTIIREFSQVSFSDNMILGALSVIFFKKKKDLIYCGNNCRANATYKESKSVVHPAESLSAWMRCGKAWLGWHSQECWLVAGWGWDPDSADWNLWQIHVIFSNYRLLWGPPWSIEAVPLQPLPSPFHLCCFSSVWPQLHRGSNTHWHGPGWRLSAFP